MSKSIIINEAGLPKTLTVDALRLPKLGGGTLDVVPADGKNLVKITVKRNGTYNASDFGAYGIAEVRVACTLNGGSATSEAAAKDIAEAFTPAPSEGGVGRIFTATRIETPLSGGGTCQWLRKSDVTLGTKSINVDNTTYRAADDGYYGYSQVTVSGISITKTTDGDGNEVVTHTDGTGTETIKVPSSIAVYKLPTKRDYSNGDHIDYTGMIVKAYLADGNLWTDNNHPDGIIRNEELNLPAIYIGYEYDITTKYYDHEYFSDVSPLLITYAVTASRRYESYGYNHYDKFLIGYPYSMGGGYIMHNDADDRYYVPVSRKPGTYESGDGITMMHYEYETATKNQQGIIEYEGKWDETTDYDNMGRRYKHLLNGTGIDVTGGVSYGKYMPDGIIPGRANSRIIGSIYQSYNEGLQNNANINHFTANNEDEFEDKVIKYSWLYTNGNTGHMTKIPISWNRIGDGETLNAYITY